MEPGDAAGVRSSPIELAADYCARDAPIVSVSLRGESGLTVSP
jgi:hypothetical protein